MSEFLLKIMFFYMTVGQIVLIYHMYKVYKKDREGFWLVVLGGVLIMMMAYAFIWPLCTVED